MKFIRILIFCKIFNNIFWVKDVFLPFISQVLYIWDVHPGLVGHPATEPTLKVSEHLGRPFRVNHTSRHSIIKPPMFVPSIKSPFQAGNILIE